MRIDPHYFRPTEVEVLIANPERSARVLGWEPRLKFEELVKIMVDADLRSAGIAPPAAGDEILARTYPEKWWGAD